VVIAGEKAAANPRSGIRRPQIILSHRTPTRKALAPDHALDVAWTIVLVKREEGFPSGFRCH